MKTNFIFKVTGFLSLILGAVLLVGCEGFPWGENDTPQYRVTASAGEGGQISPNGTIIVDEGSNQSYSVIANPGYNIESVIVNGNSQSLIDNKYFSLKGIYEDYNIEATFKKSLYWDLLVEGEWRQDSLIFHQLDGTWTRTLLWGAPGNIQRIVSFFPDGKILFYNEKGKKVGTDLWYIDESQNPPLLHMGMTETLPEGDVSIIEVLDENLLVLAKYNSPYLEDPKKKADFKNKYGHIPTKR
ncbi:MAG TPA: hypothetical protein VK153_00360 [Candidatus Paceibacterota bacterium]|nr:hypothetical protein [Candidatus Paceibacterota bacterium]